MTTKSLTELGLSSADLAAIGKLSETGMTPDQISDAVEKIHSVQSSASEIDSSVSKKQMVLPKALISKGKDVFTFDTLDGATFYPLDSSAVYTIKNESYFDGVSLLELKDTISRTTNITIPCDLSLMNIDSLSFYLWVESLSKIGNITIDLSTSISSFANRCSIVLRNHLTPLSNHWNNIRLRLSDFTFTGTCTNKSFIKAIRITTSSAASQTPWVKFGGIKANVKPRTAITFSFDDGFMTDFTVVHQKLKDRGFKFIAYIISNTIGTSLGGQRMTLQECKQILQDGSYIGLHSSPVYTNISLEEVDTLISSHLNYILDNDLKNKGMYHLSYPHGAYNDSIIEVLKKYNILSARTTNLRPQQSPVEDLYKIKLGLSLFDTLQENIDVLESLIAKGGLINIYSHELLGSKAEVFNQFVDYIYENHKEKVTSIPEWVEDYETGAYI